MSAWTSGALVERLDEIWLKSKFLSNHRSKTDIISPIKSNWSNRSLNNVVGRRSEIWFQLGVREATVSILLLKQLDNPGQALLYALHMLHLPLHVLHVALKVWLLRSSKIDDNNCYHIETGPQRIEYSKLGKYVTEEAKHYFGYGTSAFRWSS